MSDDHVKRLLGLGAGLALGAGAVPMVAQDVRFDVKLAGLYFACAAAVLTDIKSGGKLGVLKAIRALPGMGKADEYEILGYFCLAANAVLTAGAANDLMHSGDPKLGFLLAADGVSYPLGNLLCFNKIMQPLEKKVGKAGAFNIQQGFFLGGAAGVFAFGQSVSAADIMFSGAMFALNAGLGITALNTQPIGNACKKFSEGIKSAASDYQKNPRASMQVTQNLNRLQAMYKTAKEEFFRGRSLPKGETEITSKGIMKMVDAVRAVVPIPELESATTSR